MKKYKVFVSIFIIYIIINMVLFPNLYICATSEGIKAWAVAVLPSVLPFIFFTKLLFSNLDLSKTSPFLSIPCKTLWNCSGQAFFVFLCSIISGYPVGAAMTADLYQSGKISRSEAFRMCSFCSTSGPMFIIGSVGIAMFHNAKFGYIILFSHIVGALLNGILYRKLNATDGFSHGSEIKNNSNALANLIQDSITGVLSVGAIIAIFFVIITSLAPVFNLFPKQIAAFLEGAVEITKGCISLSNNFHGFWAVVGATFIISFGGISTILQSISFLSKINMPIKIFVLQKLTHALLSGVVSIILFILI